MVLEKTLESPLDNKKIKPVSPTENQPWIFVGKTDAEVAILWPHDVHIGKDPDAGKGCRQEGKGVTEDKMIKWQYQFNGPEFWADSGR